MEVRKLERDSEEEEKKERKGYKKNCEEEAQRGQQNTHDTEEEEILEWKGLSRHKAQGSEGEKMDRQDHVRKDKDVRKAIRNLLLCKAVKILKDLNCISGLFNLGFGV